MFFVYIAFNSKNELCDISVTINMTRRIQLLEYTKKSICKIVYYEEFEDSSVATKRAEDLQSFSFELIQKLVIENNPIKADLINNNKSISQ